MSSIPDWRSIGIHFLLAIAFEISEFPVFGNIIHANKACMNVSDEIICYFKASDDLMNWNTARHLCRSFNSTLPVIRNENDQVAIASYLRSNINPSVSWTAGKNFTYSTWTWIKYGKSFKEVQETYEMKDDIYPDENGQIVKKDNAAFETDFKFSALAAFDELPYICQYNGAYCNSSRDNVMIANENCLRLISDRRTWYNARNHCLATKGDLAVIGMAERDVLTKLKLNQSYWIGLRKQSWLWTLNDNVESNDEIKFTNWDNAYATHGECIAIDATKDTWKALACSEINTVVCQIVADQGTPPTAIHALTLFVAVGVGIIVVICIIVIVVFVLRTKDRRSEQSKHNDGYVKNNREELDVRITNAPVYTSINEPADASVDRSDDIRGVYVDIAMLTPEQSEDGGTNQQPGIVYASLDFNKDPTNLEPDKTHATSPTKVGPLGDIYAVPDAKSNAVTSPSDGSTSHPVKVTPQGDVYAIPMKMSTSPTAKTPIVAVYANLQTATLDKEEVADDNGETK